MKTIVAIGGGEIGRPGTKRETVSIDKYVISLSNKKHPNLLFLPTASGDAQGYIDTVKKYFGSFLGCHVETLCLSQNPSKKTIEQKVFDADIIYVGGGNTKKMLAVWKKYNLPPLLKKAWESGTILTGLSAGAICWFTYGHSDSLKEKTGEYCLVRGLNFINGIACPHTFKEKERLPSFKKMLKEHGGIGYSMDDCSAIVFRDNEVYSISSKRGRNAYVCEWTK